VASGERILLAAFDESTLVGTVQIPTAMPPNQSQRADIAKMLVHRSARRRGVASLLMQEAEREAKSAGKTLLVLNTVTGGDAERLYQRLRWLKQASSPITLCSPTASWCDTTIFWEAI
jgi:GNAT superfamily N-acetyltransferase